MYLDPPAFVLERRINQPPGLVNVALSTGAPFRRSTGAALDADGILDVDDPFRRTLGTFDLAWRTEGRLLTTRGRQVASVVLVVDDWCGGATRLRLRPVARHPERWGRWRLRRYFRLAHLAADLTARLLDEQAQVPQLEPLPQLVGASN